MTTWCHGYTVEIDGDALVVTCAVCGPSRIPVAHARRLAEDLVGPFGRFTAKAKLHERQALRTLILDALDRPGPPVLT